MKLCELNRADGNERNHSPLMACRSLAILPKAEPRSELVIYMFTTDFAVVVVELFVVVGCCLFALRYIR